MNLSLKLLVSVFIISFFNLLREFVVEIISVLAFSIMYVLLEFITEVCLFCGTQHLRLSRIALVSCFQLKHNKREEKRSVLDKANEGGYGEMCGLAAMARLCRRNGANPSGQLQGLLFSTRAC